MNEPEVKAGHGNYVLGRSKAGAARLDAQARLIDTERESRLQLEASP